MTSERSSMVDALRGFACVSVVLFHYTDRIPYDAMRYDYPILPGLWSWGWVGPYWFFVISGFCMVGSITKSADAIAFLSKRLSRIYPAYFVALIIIIIFGSVVTPVTYAPGNYTSALPPFVDIIANFFFATDFGFNFVDGAFWTLVVELKFYLILATIYFLSNGRNIEWTTMVLGASAVVLGLAWIALRIPHGEIPFLAKLLNAAISKIVIAPYLPFFALGLLVQRFLATEKIKFGVLALPVLLITCFIIYIRKSESHYAYEDSIKTVGVFLSVLIFMLLVLKYKTVDRVLMILPMRPIISVLTRFGAVSYSWYLVHQNIGMTSIYHLNAFVPAWLSLTFVLAATYLFAEILSTTVEWRFRKNFEVAVSSFAYRLISPFATISSSRADTK